MVSRAGSFKRASFDRRFPWSASRSLTVRSCRWARQLATRDDRVADRWTARPTVHSMRHASPANARLAAYTAGGHSWRSPRAGSMALGDVLDDGCALAQAVAGADPHADPREPVTHVLVSKQRVDRSGQLPIGAAVCREPSAETELVDPLRVVVLVPEQWQHNHRLAEVQRLG